MAIIVTSRSADLSLLDELNQFLSDHPNGKMEDFNPKSSGSSLPSLPEENKIIYTEHLKAIAQYIEQLPKNPCWNLEQLEKAVANNWLLTTKQVMELIGVKPTGESYTVANWTFIKTGKWGRQAAWQVKKLPPQ